MARDDFESGGPPVRQPSGLDAFFTSYFVLAIVLAVCCNLVGLILGIIGLVVCQDPKAKQNALIVTIIGGVITALGIVIQFSGILGRR